LESGNWPHSRGHQVLEAGDDVVDKFLAEALIMKELYHPKIVKVNHCDTKYAENGINFGEYIVGLAHP
jgi:hypothetical protein